MISSDDSPQQSPSEGCHGVTGLSGTQAGAIGVRNHLLAIMPGSDSTAHLMELITHRDNLNRAFMRVVTNKGSAGVDGMTVDDLLEWCREHKGTLLERLLGGSYKPSPVRGVSIPKPNGGQRELGIPTVVDRLVQQAFHQVLSPILEKLFSPFSFGFRPGLGAHDALLKASEHIRTGCTYVVDLDLEKFFDRVNHDLLMGRLARHIKDKRVLKITRAFLEAGLLKSGVVVPRSKGTPQGGPLSPLLSNLLLDDLDKELERRGHRFVRYADDVNVYVQSERAGQRVLESVTGFLEKKLKLRVNKEKSAVGEVWTRSFLGYRLFQQWERWLESENPLPF